MTSRKEHDSWRSIHLDELEAVPWRGSDLIWRPVRSALGTSVVGMAAYTAQRAGQPLIEEHREDEDGRGHEEVYFVLSGAAAFMLDGERLDAVAGTFVLVAPQVRRSAVATEAGSAILALGGPSTFEPSPSEWIERARPHIRTDPALASELIDELRATQPDSPGVVVADALLALGRGEQQRALEFVSDVLRRWPQAEPALRADPDLGPILPAPHP
ncbi:MAG: hypothetical protein ABSG64_00220 [Solirubrobacteraceae bacterium]